MVTHKRLVISCLLLFIILICIIVLQNKKLNSLTVQLVETKQQLIDKEQIASTYKNQFAIRENVILKIDAGYKSEKKKLNEKLERANSLVSANESILFGDKSPVVDSSISPDILSVVYRLYEAMQTNDIEEFIKMDKKGILLENFYEKRDDIEKILWIRHDPDHRAKAIQEWYEIKSDVELLKVYVLRKDKSISDPNIAMMKENGKWIIFRED